MESTLDGSMRCDIQMWQNLKVPLLGLWGAISYAPAMVRRQIGSKRNSSLLVEACELLSLPAYLYTRPLRKIPPLILILNSGISA